MDSICRKKDASYRKSNKNSKLFSLRKVEEAVCDISRLSCDCVILKPYAVLIQKQYN